MSNTSTRWKLAEAQFSAVSLSQPGAGHAFMRAIWRGSSSSACAASTQVATASGKDCTMLRKPSSALAFCWSNSSRASYSRAPAAHHMVWGAVQHVQTPAGQLHELQHHSVSGWLLVRARVHNRFW